MSSNKEEKEINILRRNFGLQPIKITVRKCLDCGKEFKSANNGNRICDKCRHEHLGD